MTARLVLCRAAAGTLASTLPPARDLVGWHQALTAEITAGLGAAHAGILAQPADAAGGLEWIAVGDRAVGLTALPKAGREALVGAAGSILADIGALAASGAAPAVAAAWPALRRLPDETYLYAVDGRPVLAAWGHAPVAAANWPDPLAPLLPPRAPILTVPAPGKSHYGLITLFVAVAFIFGLLLPALAFYPFTCAPPGLDAIARVNAAIAQNALLSTQLAQLDEQAAAQKAQCTTLPQQAWNQGKLDMLNGCWHLISNMILQDVQTGAPEQVSNWRICFGQDGSGTQQLQYADGTSCQGPVQAQFTPQHELTIEEPSECAGSSNLIIGQWLCDRTSATQAKCVRTDRFGHSRGVFQR